MAEYSLLREIRKLDPEIDITLICSDNRDFYFKPMLSNALANNKTPAYPLVVAPPADQTPDWQETASVKNRS